MNEAQANSCGVSGSLGADSDQAAFAPEAPPLESPDAALEIGREMSGVTLPQGGIAPILAGHAAAAGGRAARALELVVSGAVAHGVVDGDFLARVDPVQSDDRDLPVETGIRLATVIDEVRRLIGREGGEIESSSTCTVCRLISSGSSSSASVEMMRPLQTAISSPGSIRSRA